CWQVKGADATQQREGCKQGTVQFQRCAPSSNGLAARQTCCRKRRTVVSIVPAAGDRRGGWLHSLSGKWMSSNRIATSFRHGTAHRQDVCVLVLLACRDGSQG